jgi:hypothetical protein
MAIIGSQKLGLTRNDKVSASVVLILAKQGLPLLEHFPAAKISKDLHYFQGQGREKWNLT